MGKSHCWVWFHFCCKRARNLVTLFTHLYVSMSVQLSCERRRAKARHWWNFTSIHRSLMLSLTHVLVQLVHFLSFILSFLSSFIHLVFHSVINSFIYFFSSLFTYLFISQNQELRRQKVLGHDKQMEALELRNKQLVEYIEDLERDLAGRMAEQVIIIIR